jgi:hypothetical protein
MPTKNKRRLIMEEYCDSLKELSSDIRNTCALIQNDYEKLLNDKIITRQDIWENYYEFKNRMACHILVLTQLKERVSKEFLRIYDDSENIKVDDECYARFTGHNGYPFENRSANQLLEVGKLYKVVGGSMSQSNTDLVLEGFEFVRFNSVMFEIEGELPFKFEDFYVTHKQLKTWLKDNEITNVTTDEETFPR